MTDWSRYQGYGKPLWARMSGSNYHPESEPSVADVKRQLDACTASASSPAIRPKKARTKKVGVAKPKTVPAPIAIDLGFGRVFGILRSLAPAE